MPEVPADVLGELLHGGIATPRLLLQGFQDDGVEIAGGSIRIHQPDIQAKVFEAIGISAEEAQSKFSFLLEAFRYGPPPHGGIALGVDRWVMLFAGLENIREVIAFPKTQRATDLMTEAPGSVDRRQLDETLSRGS